AGLDEALASGGAQGENDARYAAEPEGGTPQTHYRDFVFQPFTDQDGSVGGIVVVGMDNTERTRNEKALRERESELEALNSDLERRVAEQAREHSLNWQVTPGMLGVLNRHGILERRHPAREPVLGWTRAELALVPIR